MSEVKEEKIESGDMPKPGSTKVTIDVPSNKYDVLNNIKDATGKSIRALVSEGVDLIILKNEILLEESAKTAAEKAT